MTDLISIVKENLPSNVTITREPYRAKLSDDLLYVHGYIGHVFHFNIKHENGNCVEDMLFISDSANNAFHCAISLFGKSIEELSKRCYWVDENGIIMEALKI